MKHQRRRHHLIQAFVCRLKTGRFGLVIWGGPYNGFVSNFTLVGSARMKAILCGADILHVDI